MGIPSAASSALKHQEHLQSGDSEESSLPRPIEGEGWIRAASSEPARLGHLTAPAVASRVRACDSGGNLDKSILARPDFSAEPGDPQQPFPVMSGRRATRKLTHYPSIIIQNYF
jgi:hypothetical protein